MQLHAPLHRRTPGPRQRFPSNWPHIIAQTVEVADMGWLRRMRRVATWLRTQQGLLAVTLSIAMAVLVATWFHIHGQAERAAAVTASRIPAAEARETAPEIKNPDFLL